MESTAENEFKKIHDFTTERLVLKILGGYCVLRKPTFYFITNILLIICILILYGYLGAMGIYTLIFTTNDGAIKVQTFQTLCLIFVAVSAPLIKFCHDSNLGEALKLLNNGIYQYKEEIPDAEYRQIIENRISQIKVISSSYAIGCYICATANTVQSPIMQLLLPKQNLPEDSVNPFLPLPLCMAFNSRTYYGFMLAFFANGLFLFLFYTSVICITESYLSYGLQIIAQLESMNYSLRNIEKRAISKLRLHREFHIEEGLSEILYDKQEFQMHLYLCLRANIQHHHAILRFTQEIKSYLEPMNSLLLLVFAVIFASSIVPVIQDPAGYMALSTTLVAEMTGYLQMYWVGQVITDKSAETLQSLYSTPWPYCDKKFKVLLTVMITNTKKPIVFKSPGFGTSMSLETFGDMMSMAYKLVNVLLNTV